MLSGRVFAVVLVAVAVAGAWAALRAPAADRPAHERVAFRDPWPASVRRELRLERVVTRECPRSQSRPNLRIQNRESKADPRAKLRRALDPRWGGMWFDNCDRGRLKVGIAHGPRDEMARRVHAARKVLREVRLDDVTDLVAVRSTIRRLSDAQERYTEPLDDLFNRGLITAGRDDLFNAMIIETARTLPDDDYRRLKSAARRTGVNVYFENTREDDLFVTPL